MAEAVLAVVVDQLWAAMFKFLRSELSVEDRHSVHAKILWAEREVAELRDAIEDIEAQPDNELDDQKQQWIFEAKKLESEAASLTETNVKKFEQMQGHPGLSLVKFCKYWFMGKELMKIQLRMGEVMTGVNNRQQDADTLDLQDTTSKSSIYAYATSAMKNLEVSNGGLSYIQQFMFRDIKSTRSQLLPLFEILKQLVNVNVYRDYERYRVWTLMVEDIFKSIDEQSVFFRKLPFREKNSIDFFTIIKQKKEEIFILWGRCHTYGVGLVVPHIEPATLRSKFFLPAEVKWKLNRPSILKRVEEYKELLKPIIKVFKKDQILMNALWEDLKGMEEVDERGKIWLKKMKEAHRELEAVCQKHSIYLSNPFTTVKQYSRLLQSARLLEEFIYVLTMWKIYYCIDNFPQRDGPSSTHTEEEEEKAVLLPSNFIKTDMVELVQIELQLMEALFEDVKTIEKLDERLKVWIQEMRCVANHSKPIIRQILNGSFTRKVAAKNIKLIRERIRHISEWSITYSIGSIRSGKGSSSLNQELEEVSPYPTVRVADDVDLLRREVRMMQALESDIQKMHGVNSGTLEAWLEEMHEVAGEAQILISSYSNNGNNAKSRRKVLQNVSLIKSKIQELHERRIVYGIEHFDRKHSFTAEELRARLLTDESEPKSIILILGAWDNDKAFVKKFIEEDDLIVSRYESRSWVSAGEANERTILENIERVVEQKGSNGSLIVSSQNLSLIVLDEIKSSFNLNLVRELPRTSKGSRLILITSQRNVELYGLNPCEKLSSITMRVLPPQGKISMLQMVPENSDSNQSLTTSNSSKETIPSYLRECLYYFLLFPPTNSGNYISVRRLISLWVAEGFVRQRRSEDDVPLELIAMRYLLELIQKGVVEAEEKGGKPKRCRLKDDKRDEYLTQAREKQFFQENWKNSEQVGSYFGVEIGNIFRLTDQPGDDKYKSCHNQIHDPVNHPTSFISHYKQVLSFLSFDSQERSKPGEDIGRFLDKFISKKCFLSLRILDLEHIFRPALPKDLAKLIRLRYLGLRWTYLEALPQSVSELLNLQVLDMKHTYISKLPESIWRMQFLRHLYLSETYRTRFSDKPQGSMSLTYLQTLWGAFVDEDSPVEGGLDTLLNVGKLGLLCRSMYEKGKMARQLEAVANWVVRLKDLESLRLRSQDENGDPSDLYLKPLSAHGNLSVLHISGILKYPSVISDLPLNLTEVTLSGCKLENDPLHSMEFLPTLIILRLLVDASNCREMRCSSRGFPKLEVLKLWKLEMLEVVEVKEGGMPLLHDFDIRSCPNLGKLANRLEHIPKRTQNQDSTSTGTEGNVNSQRHGIVEV